jgi:hypothetical protein
MPRKVRLFQPNGRSVDRTWKCRPARNLKQAAWWMPDVPAGAQRVCSNDVYVDHRGLIYLIDRNRGLSILERV